MAGGRCSPPSRIIRKSEKNKSKSRKSRKCIKTVVIGADNSPRGGASGPGRLGPAADRWRSALHRRGMGNAYTLDPDGGCAPAHTRQTATSATATAAATAAALLVPGPSRPRRTRHSCDEPATHRSFPARSRI